MNRLLPELALQDWEPTYLTLHRWTQVVGKICLALAPPLNHWWHCALSVSSEGLRTPCLPCQGRALTIAFDFGEHRLLAHSSDGRRVSFPLEAMPVAEFHCRALSLLADLGVSVSIWPVPVEVVDVTPFTHDHGHAAYDPRAVERLHRILLFCDEVFATFRGRFVGKSSPVNFYWGAFDLAVGRFSGRANPSPPADRVMSAAYSHEVIAHGFWPGGDWPMGGRMHDAAFYAYAVPEPAGFRDAAIEPPPAGYDTRFNEFIVPYEAVRTSDDPRGALLRFMQSTYMAAASAGNWDVESFAMHVDGGAARA